MRMRILVMALWLSIVFAPKEGIINEGTDLKRRRDVSCHLFKVTAAGEHVNLTASELARSTQSSPSSASQALLSSLKVQGVWYRPEVAVSLILITEAFKRRERHSAPHFLSCLF